MNDIPDVHVDCDGEEWRLENLSDRHLVNILKMLERKAKEGVVVPLGYGAIEACCWDTYEVYGEAALEALEYGKYQREYQRRHGRSWVGDR